MTRISTAGEWVQASKPSPPSITKVCLVRNVFIVAHRYAWATSATVPVRSRDMILCEWPLWRRIFNVRYFRFWPISDRLAPPNPDIQPEEAGTAGIRQNPRF